MSETSAGESKVPAQSHKKGSVRHAEKRRNGTCAFADCVAKISLAAYRKFIVPLRDSNDNSQICIAAIVAHFPPTIDPNANTITESNPEVSNFHVLGLGVGTKYLQADLITNESSDFGKRVRDCHAEVLARRAFRRQLSLEILHDLQSGEGSNKTGGANSPAKMSILERIPGSKTRYQLKDGVTLHFYSSSTPCGNSTVKKFTEMKKEKFNHCLHANEWPESAHERIGPHSVKMGQFALLLKRDDTILKNVDSGLVYTRFQEPPGTSLTCGLIHSCSDKICRWNCLGLQGGLLSRFFEKPIYMQTITVGRKFTNAVCRRAICCRAWGYESSSSNGSYRLNHPTVMGTSVYVDEDGVVEMDQTTFGKNAIFESLCWVYLQGMVEREVECIDGNTGHMHVHLSEPNESSVDGHQQHVSKVSTFALYDIYRQIKDGTDSIPSSALIALNSLSLEELMAVKKKDAPNYDAAKEKFYQHRVFRAWKRR